MSCPYPMALRCVTRPHSPTLHPAGDAPRPDSFDTRHSSPATPPMVQLTGTFLDEITHDIPSQNWGPDDWAADFAAMKDAGIDTVILIRAGYRKKVTFDSAVLAERVGTLPAYGDLVDLYLSLAEQHGMTFVFGTYDAGIYWDGGDYAQEAAINKPFCEEVVRRYGHRRAFGGWYISHEISTYNPAMMSVYEDLSAHLRRLKDLPVLMSPFIKGVKQFGDDALTLDQHAAEWEETFRRLAGHVDIVAFQDGNVPLGDLPAYLAVNRDLASKFGLRSWSNVESFGRDAHIKFPPIDIRHLRYKMEQAAAAGMEKLITFEWSHFMSPHATVFPSARTLHARYMDWLSEQGWRG